MLYRIVYILFCFYLILVLVFLLCAFDIFFFLILFCVILVLPLILFQIFIKAIFHIFEAQVFHIILKCISALFQLTKRYLEVLVLINNNNVMRNALIHEVV